jgi:drug/metabolite transporter (DMT)-like permease
MRRSSSGRARPGGGIATPAGDRMRAMRRWGKWLGAVIVVYGLFLVVVGLVTRPANPGRTVVVVVMGAVIAAVGWLVSWRSVRNREP